MQYKVYKSLDKKSSLFGLTGSYLFWAVGGVGLAVICGIVVGNILNGLVGFVAFSALAALAYLVVMRIQSRYSEKERAKWLCKRDLPDFVQVPPVRFSTLRPNIDYTDTTRR